MSHESNQSTLLVYSGIAKTIETTLLEVPITTQYLLTGLEELEFPLFSWTGAVLIGNHTLLFDAQSAKKGWQHTPQKTHILCLGHQIFELCTTHPIPLSGGFFFFWKGGGEVQCALASLIGKPRTLALFLHNTLYSRRKWKKMDWKISARGAGRGRKVGRDNQRKLRSSEEINEEKHWINTTARGSRSFSKDIPSGRWRRFSFSFGTELKREGAFAMFFLIK